MSEVAKLDKLEGGILKLFIQYLQRDTFSYRIK